ncbi:MAG TPA: amylo-alpha-1,6-glucosidase [Phycisphaerae bacterium]|nr:amylo-alpha-1,6-glucosidase [Phycisphaerae bacterium]
MQRFDGSAEWSEADGLGGFASGTVGGVRTRGTVCPRAPRFRSRSWSHARGCLYDVVDCDHRAGKAGPHFRPNQILAVGGLPIALMENGRARRIVDAVEQRLWTPLGLRSLAPDDPEHAPHHRGGVRERDGAYHQGAIWPWLIGPFAEAWLRVRENTSEARREARERFIKPLREHLGHAGLGHMSEVADGAPLHRPGGCPFQAWPLGELMRLEHVVLAERPATGARAISGAAAETFAAAPHGAVRHV